MGTIDLAQTDLMTRACAVTKALCALPAVATLDWCDRAAACMCLTDEQATALLILGTLEASGRFSRREAVGVAGAPAGTGLAGSRMEPAALTMLRAQAHRLVGLGLAPPPRGRAAALDQLAPGWRDGPLGRMLAPFPGHVVAASIPLGDAEGRSVTVLLAAGCPAPEAAAVLEATLPILADRASSCLGGGSRTWLTHREQEVLEQLTLGKSVKEIAEAIGRSPHTVHDHVKSLHRKLGASTRGELIARALGHLPTPAPAPEIRTDSRARLRAAPAEALMSRAG